MKFYVAVTDNAWFDRLLALHPPPDEVNFWLPGGRSVRHEVGTPWLFKLHAPENKIAGIGYFTYSPRCRWGSSGKPLKSAMA